MLVTFYALCYSDTRKLLAYMGGQPTIWFEIQAFLDPPRPPQCPSNVLDFFNISFNHLSFNL